MQINHLAIKTGISLSILTSRETSQQEADENVN